MEEKNIHVWLLGFFL